MPTLIYILDLIFIRFENQNVMTDGAQEVTLLRTQIQEVISERNELRNQLRSV